MLLYSILYSMKNSIKKTFLILCFTSLILGFEVVPKAGIGYNSNPWSFSEDDAPIELKGDVFSTISLDIDKRITRLGKWSIKGSFDVSYKNYAQNSKKGLFKLEPKLTAIKKGFWFSTSYQYIPEYNIRPVKDADDGYIYRFPHYTANQFLMRSAFSPIKDFWLEGRGEYQLNYYDVHFLEYDQNQWSLGGYLRYSGKLYIKTGYRFSVSDSRGFDVEGESREDSDDTDGSYEEDRFYLRLGKDFGKLSTYVSSTYYLRYFTSAKEDDVIHIGRKDTYKSVNLQIGYDFGKVELELKTSFTDRDSDSDLNPELPSLRDYDSYNIGLYVQYNKIKF